MSKATVKKLLRSMLKEDIIEMVMSELVYMHLITYKRKVLAERKDEVLNIRDY